VTSKRRSQKKGIIATLIALAVLAPVAALSPWLLSVALILACGVYVAFEFALVKVPMRRLERDAEAGLGGAAVVLGMKRDMNAMLAACQFGITLTSLGLTLALEPAIHHALGAYEQVAQYSAALAMALGAFFHVTFGELIPKGLALVVPGKVLYVTAPFMRLFRLAAVPFIKTCNAIANVVVKGLTGKNPDTDAHHEEGVEIGEALLYAHASGEIKPQQLQLMRNVLSFADRTAREAMTPARQVITLDLQSSWQDNMVLAEEHGYSRFPVVDGDPNNVVGYARRAEILKAEIKGTRDLGALLRPIERRPETMSLAKLNLFQGTPMIALFDEHDTFTGLLTAEDLVEQIVGEIYDETDERTAPDVVPLDGGAVRLSGSVLLERAAEVLGLPEIADHEDVDTIGGLVLKLLGRQPRAGDVVDLEGYKAAVESAKGFRIVSLLFTPPPPEEPPAEAP
jgi:CBS domain containing-hemolysin-like protein